LKPIFQWHLLEEKEAELLKKHNKPICKIVSYKFDSGNIDCIFCLYDCKEIGACSGLLNSFFMYF